MRSSKTILLTSVLTAGCLLSACAGSPNGLTTSSPSPMPPASASCDSNQAQGAIGERASDGLLQRARMAAGAASARYRRPDDRVTMEYLGSRLNLVLDAHDVVRSVVCG